MEYKKKFKLKSDYKPLGDQPQAIEKLSKGILKGIKHQTLLGATGTGKTFTMANIIQQVQKPTLIIAHNKTLAAQLAAEFKNLFPENAVRYFVSYYDYYQPEAYIPSTDQYIEKSAQINEEIEKYRNAATQSLLTREDVIIVASVSCIYGLGNPENYESLAIKIKKNSNISRNELLRKLVGIQYIRNDMDLIPGTFRVRGETLDIYPSYSEEIIRVEFFDNEIESIKVINPILGNILCEYEEVDIFPSKHWVTPFEILKQRIPLIEKELKERVEELKKQGKDLEAKRLEQRTKYDIEMLEEVGYCNGIENYSRIIEGRKPGEPGFCLLDYFPKDYLLFIDESHITIPQIRGMYYGDRSRKQTLIEYGFRLPSALDNRPLNFQEFCQRTNQVIYVSATPQEYELILSIQEASKTYKIKDYKMQQIIKEYINKPKIKKYLEENYVSEQKEVKQVGNKLYSQIITQLNYEDYYKTGIAQQIIRPTGLLDPLVEVRPTAGQIVDLIEEIKIRKNKNQRALITTLTKKMAEELSLYLKEQGINVEYLHSDVETIQRVELLKALRLGSIDVIVGINLLREGLDLPEVSLVAILDADKEGFLRNQTSLIQTIGRAARHPEGLVIMYADYITESIKLAIEETSRRRKIQEEYNSKHGIIPKPIIKPIEDQLIRTKKNDNKKQKSNNKVNLNVTNLRKEEIQELIDEYKQKMIKAAEELEFYKAAEYRDTMFYLQSLIDKN